MLPLLIFNRALICLNLVLAFNALAFEVSGRIEICNPWNLVLAPLPAHSCAVSLDGLICMMIILRY